MTGLLQKLRYKNWILPGAVLITLLNDATEKAGPHHVKLLGRFHLRSMWNNRSVTAVNTLAVTARRILDYFHTTDHIE